MGIFLLCTGMAALGQDLRSIIVDESDNGKVFSSFLQEIERKHNVDFIFDADEIEAYTVNGITGRQRLMDFLDKFLIHHAVTRVADNVVFIVGRLGDTFGGRRDDFIQLSSRFPRLTAPTPLARLKEIITFLHNLPAT